MLIDDSPWRICIAPMLDWTDRHYRYFMRQMTRQTKLYTEMIHANALFYGESKRYIDFNDIEQPLALQIAGNDPKKLAYCANLAKKIGYREINLNIGCPSLHAQQGFFGACLMKDIPKIIHCVDAIKQKVSIDLSIKHRIGIEGIENYDFLASFVDQLFDAGCHIFIVHARQALLKASPKKNRTVPPLNYEYVYRLKRDYPNCTIVINGGIRTMDEISKHLRYVDGVMIGREAYQNPYLFSKIDQHFFDEPLKQVTRQSIIMAMIAYTKTQLLTQPDVKVQQIIKPLLNLYHGEKGAKWWRQYLSSCTPKNSNLLQEAAKKMQEFESPYIL